MKISLKTFIIVLVASYSIMAAITLLLRIINNGGWSELQRYVITIFFIIPIFSFVCGIMGCILLKNIWIATIANFICCLCVMPLLYSSQNYYTNTILDWLGYSLVISIITFFSSSITYFIRKFY